MKLHSIPISDIEIPTNRQRQDFPYEAIAELAGSISQNGLISPIVVRKGANGNVILVAGERRLRALNYLWTFGEGLRCGDQRFSDNIVPCLYLGELDPVDAYEVELEENIRRCDLTWQEKAAATANLARLRVMQARKLGKEIPEIADFSKEAHPNEGYSSAIDNTRKELILSKHLGDEDIAKATTLNEGFKILKRKEELERAERLGVEVGKTFSVQDHKLWHGNCLTDMKAMIEDQLSFDVILSDPPYGIDAQDFGDSGGVGGSLGGHFYDDSPESWINLIEDFGPRSYAITKPQAHLYLFCDVERFATLKELLTSAGWKVFRTPLIWVNPGGMRAPWPTQGPQRKWQMILYAVKGDKLVKKLCPDIITCPADSNLGHPAQKPVGVYQDLLRRSCDPGDSVLDPFCGTGTIFPAAHSVKVRATGIEMDDASYGIAVKRLEGLK